MQHAFDTEDEFDQAAKRTIERGLGHHLHVVHDHQPELEIPETDPTPNFTEPVHGYLSFPYWPNGVVGEVDPLGNPFPHIAFGPGRRNR